MSGRLLPTYLHLQNLPVTLSHIPEARIGDFGNSDRFGRHFFYLGQNMNNCEEGKIFSNPSENIITFEQLYIWTPNLPEKLAELCTDL